MTSEMSSPEGARTRGRARRTKQVLRFSTVIFRCELQSEIKNQAIRTRH
jgi:hypothetical protein